MTVSEVLSLLGFLIVFGTTVAAATFWIGLKISASAEELRSELESVLSEVRSIGGQIHNIHTETAVMKTLVGEGLRPMLQQAQKDIRAHDDRILRLETTITHVALNKRENGAHSKGEKEAGV